MCVRVVVVVKDEMKAKAKIEEITEGKENDTAAETKTGI